jgi:transcription elongation factor GreA
MPTLLTNEGLAQLQDRRKEIVEVLLPNILEAVDIARQQGDLRENAAFQSALKSRDELQAELFQIDEVLNGDYELVEAQDSKGSLTVKFGSTVSIMYLSNNEVHTIKIVGSSESNILENKISNESPLALAILGKKVGTEASFRTPVGQIKVKILEIK